MVSVQTRIVDRTLVLEPKGKLSKMASVTRKLKIPISAIRNVSTEPVQDVRKLKIVGTNIPPHYAGTFYDTSTREKLFYTFSNKEKCLTLSLEDFKFGKVVVEVDNKEEAAEMIKTAISRNSI